MKRIGGIKMLGVLLTVLPLLLFSMRVYGENDERHSASQIGSPAPEKTNAMTSVTHGGLQRLQSKANTEETEEAIQSSNRSYSQKLSSWMKESNSVPKISHRGAAKKSLTQEQEADLKSAEHFKQEIKDNILSDNELDAASLKKLINISVEKLDYESAYDLAARLYRENPSDKEAKSEYAKIYKIYSEEVLKKQAEIVSGGTK